MAQEEIALKITTEGSQTEKSVGSIRKQLREAQQEAVNLARKFGELSPEAIAAAQKVANLRDEFGDLNKRIQALDPDAKFRAFSQTLQGVAGGFAGLQGAIGLFGTESAELEKQLLKVQSALALSEGINSVLESKDAFKNLAVVIRTNVVTAFTTLRGAIIATGVGALAVGLGLLVANFDKVKKVVLNLIPGLADVAKYIGGVVQQITDFVGVTSDATRAYDELESKTKRGNESIEARIKLLKAQGGKEAEIAELTKQRVENDLNLLRAKLKAEGSLNEEELAQFRALKTEKKVIDAEETKRLNDLYKQRAEKAAEAEQKRLEKIGEARIAAYEAEKQREEAIQNETKARQDKGNEEFLERSKNTLLSRETLQQSADIKARQDAKERADFEIELEQKVFEAKQEKILAYGELLINLSNIAGRQSAVGKALAIASAAIDTYAAANKALNANYGIFGPAAQIARFAAVAATIANGLRNVKAIAAVKVPGGGGGVQNPAPAQAAFAQPPISTGVQVQQTALVQGGNQVNLQNQALVRAYVVEKDITESQARINQIKATATI